MAVSSRLSFLLFSISGFLKRIFQDGGVQALALKRWIYQRLSSCWSIYFLSPGSTDKKNGEIDSPSSRRTLERYFGELIGKSDENSARNWDRGINEEFEYTHIVDGEVIPMDDKVLPSSVYPLSGDGIRSVPGSSTSLRLSHSRAVSERSARLSATSTYLVNEGDDTRSRRSPTPSIPPSIAEDNSSNRSGITLNIIGPDDQTAQEPSAIPVSDTPEPENPYPTGFLGLTPRRPRPSSLGGRPHLTPSDLVTEPLGNSDSQAQPITNGPALTDMEASRSHDDDQSSSGTHPALYPYDSGVDVGPQAGTPLPVDAVQFPVPQTSPVLPFNRPGPRPYLNIRDIVPVMPERTSEWRYSCRPTISASEAPEGQAPISPWTTKFGKDDPEDWETCLHPEGARYFVNRQKRIYTDANLYDNSMFTQVNMVIRRIEEFSSYHNIIQLFDDGNVDLVLWFPSPAEPDGERSAYYYCVHHLSRSIFFLDDCRPEENLPAYGELLGGPTSHAHLGLEVEAQYWYHCQLFPHSPRLTIDIVQELRGLILHYISDTSTSPKWSTSPYALEDLYKLLDVVNEAEKIVPSESNSGTVSAGSTGAQSSIARIMFIFTRAKFLHFHGEPHARLDRTVSVYGLPHRRTLLVKGLSWMLFFAPDFHLRNLQSMWVDKISHKAVFQEAMKRMNDEWEQYGLLATVVIAANFAFWSVPTFTNPDSNSRSATQIASYLSAISSVGSIVIGLLLTRQNRTKMRQTVDDFEKYMAAREHPRLGLETLAILNSLPYALLMWAMVALFVALLLFCFINSDTPTRVLTGISSFCCVSLIVWCVVTNWDKEENEEGQPPAPQPTPTPLQMPYEQYTQGYNLQPLGYTTQYAHVGDGQPFFYQRRNQQAHQGVV